MNVKCDIWEIDGQSIKKGVRNTLASCVNSQNTYLYMPSTQSLKKLAERFHNHQSFLWNMIK